MKESTRWSSTQECSVTHGETVFSQQHVAQKSIPNCREGSPGRSEKNEKSIAQRQGTSARYKAEMVRTAIDPEKPVCDDRHRDLAKREEATEMMATKKRSCRQTVTPRRRR